MGTVMVVIGWRCGGGGKSLVLFIKGNTTVGLTDRVPCSSSTVPPTIFACIALGSLLLSLSPSIITRKNYSENKPVYFSLLPKPRLLV